MVPRGFSVLSLAEGFPDFYRKYVEQGKIQSNIPDSSFFLKGFRRLCKLRMWRDIPAIQTRFSSAAVEEKCQSTVFHLGLWSAVNGKHFHLSHQATFYSQTNSASELCHSSRNDAVCSPQSISKEEQEKKPQEQKVGHYWGKVWVIQHLWNHHSA